jgi:hypothetical protein
MMLRSKSLAAFAALLATGVTLGILSVARIGLDAPPINGVSLNGMPFAFDTIVAQDVQFREVSSK